MDSSRLIAGSSYKVCSEIKKIKEEYSELKKVTVFFENSNFFMTNYCPESNGVYLILEFEDGRQLHIEGANCGYRGGGPRATADILVEFGLDRKEIEKLVFHYDAVRFNVNKNEILEGTINTSYIFYPRIRYDEKDKSMRNKIVLSDNVSVDLEEAKVTFYNPQRECFKGFINLLSYLKEPRMEYYIGDNSPLEGYFRLDKDILRKSYRKSDVKNIDHVNLVVTGSNFRVVCFIDRDYEIQIIDTIHLVLMGEGLFQKERYNLLPKKRWGIKNIIRGTEYEDAIEGVVTADEERLGRRLKRR